MGDKPTLFIGNLDSRLSEYHLLQILSKFEGLKNINYLWHTHGPKRGEPRGFCFVTFETAENAERARLALDGKLALGKRLRVTYGEHLPTTKKKTRNYNKQDSAAASTPVSGFSIPGVASLDENATVTAKILAVEQKLRLMENEIALGVDDLAFAYIPPPKVERHGHGGYHQGGSSSGGRQRY